MRPKAVRKHIAFCLDQAYGHIYPTLGIASELITRGFDVSYPVSDSFANKIMQIGAEPKRFEPVLNYRLELYPAALKKDGSYDFSDGSFARRLLSLRAESTRLSMKLLESLYKGEAPDLIVHDDALDDSAREFAIKLSIRRVRIWQSIIYEKDIESFRNDDLVLIPIPDFFNGDEGSFGERFRFFGFIPIKESGDQWINPWRPEKVVFVSPTTGLLPQVEFCKLIIDALKDLPLKIVLSAAGRSDPVSRVDLQMLGELPDNVCVSEDSSHLSILEHACLFVGQGGPRSTLQAIYSGVPSLLIPPSLDHDFAARRAADLGLGIRIAISEACPRRIRDAAIFLIEDGATLARVRRAQSSMHAENGAVLAADLIEEYLRR